MTRTSVVPLPEAPRAELALRSEASGAALFDGWSDDGRWRFLLPWPEETRTVAWSDAGQWSSVVRALEEDVPEGAGALPFAGGWIGFITYEAMACDEAAQPREVPPPEPPLFFAKHRAGVAIAPNGEAFLFAPAGMEAQYRARLHPPRAIAIPRITSTVRDSLDGGAHARLVERIRAAIRDGDVYQVNLTRAFSSAMTCDAAALYDALTGAEPPRSSAMIRGEGWTIVSASPEVLLHFDRAQGVADSRPIKGTMRRAGDDDGEIAALLASRKDEAEHLMIVDVVRNDFGKVAPPGRVRVPVYRGVQTLAAVHHLESIVRAEGLQGVAVADVLTALAPAASITGAPKRAAVQMIRDLEPVPRGVYCGAIGFITRETATFSVAIRTAVVTNDGVRYHAGGGVVWDSDAAAEDDECHAKAAAFLRFVRGESER